MQKRWRDAYPLANTCAFVTKILPNNPQMQVPFLFIIALWSLQSPVNGKATLT